ncbi:hypothetical protein AAU61_04340 [Desulfocarbo indianensis]|nr:hypothetical protein AAU61_04340 [Desulfocarbo indianensis]
MSQPKPENQNSETRDQGPECPFCAMRERFDQACKDHKSLGHFHKAQVEFLRGLQSLLEEGIQWLEKKPGEKSEPRVTEIKVE